MIVMPRQIENYTDYIARAYNKRPKNITFIVCNNCDLRCTYCYEHHKENRAMSFETAKKGIDMLFDLDAKGNDKYINEQEAFAIDLDFIGGEPLLQIDLIDKICDYFLEKALKLNHRWATNHTFSISTNGMNYFQPKVQEFLAKNQGRVSLSVTVDGNKELHDKCRIDAHGNPTYDRAIAAFNDARKRFNQKGTKLTFSKANISELYKACRDMIETFDLKEIIGNPVFEDEWNLQDANIYYNELKKLADWIIETGRYKDTYIDFFNEFIGHKIDEDDLQNHCGGQGEMLAIDCDGLIYPCLRYAPLSIGEDIAKTCVIGNVDDGITDPQDFMNCLCKVNRRTKSTDECFFCPIGSGCPDCAAWNYEWAGCLDKRCTSICPMHKARVLATSYFYNSIYNKENDEARFAVNLPKELAIPIIGEEEYSLLKKLESRN